MGSAAQRVLEVAAAAGARVAHSLARVTRPKAFYGPDGPARDRRIEKRLSGYRSSKWSGVRLRADASTLASGPCQFHFVIAVYFETEGRNPQDGGATSYTAGAWVPNDFAGEAGFTRQAMQREIEDFIQRGCASSKAIDEGHADRRQPFQVFAGHEVHGADLYRFRLCLESWERLAKEWPEAQRKDMGCVREPIGSRVSDGLLKTLALTPSASNGQPVASGAQERIGAADVRCGGVVPLWSRNDTPWPLQIAYQHSADKGIVTCVQSVEARAAVEIRPPAIEPSLPRHADSRKSRSNGDGAGSKGGQGALELLDQYPESAAFVMRYPGTDRSFAGKVLAECRAAAGAVASQLTDDALLHGLRVVTKKSQESAGLYLSTAPPWAARWAEEAQRRPPAKSGPTDNPMQAYIRCRDAKRVLADPDADDGAKVRARATLREEGG